METLPQFCTIFTKDNNFCDFLFTLLYDKGLPTYGQPKKGKNLLLVETSLKANIVYHFLALSHHSMHEIDLSASF